MTLEEAINHCYEVLDRVNMCDECKEEHKQLAKWLEELKENREKLNLQKAEIEMLKNESIGNCEMAIAMRSDHNLDVDCNYCINKAKSEARKEFVEKLKRYKAYVSGWDIYVVREHHIDNLLEKMEGEA